MVKAGRSARSTNWFIEFENNFGLNGEKEEVIWVSLDLLYIWTRLFCCVTFPAGMYIQTIH